MMVTEDEASKMWCPEVCYHAEGSAVNLEDPDFDYGAVGPLYQWDNCRGSDCMMWRWADTGCDGERRGYCGKAGKP
jgi:hypothetical protein